MLVGYLIQRYSRLGRYAFAIGGAEEVLALSGVKVAPYKVAVFTLAGAFYGLAGVMVTSQLSAGLSRRARASTSRLSPRPSSAAPCSPAAAAASCTPPSASCWSPSSPSAWSRSGVEPHWQGGVQGLIVVAAVVAAVIPHRRRNEVTK